MISHEKIGDKKIPQNVSVPPIIWNLGTSVGIYQFDFHHFFTKDSSATWLYLASPLISEWKKTILEELISYLK